MSVVVLGGTGFIGRHVCEILNERGLRAAVLSHRPSSEFLALHAPRLEAYEVGTAEAHDALARAQSIIHLAHMSRPSSNLNAEPIEIEENVLPTTRILSEIAQVNPGIRVIYASSGGQIYGLGHQAPISEGATPNPSTPYALGKHLIERCLSYFAGKGHLRTTILRIGNPVGRWQLGGRHGFVSAAVYNAVHDKRVTIYGAGNNARDYFDARDLARLMVSLAVGHIVADGVFNIGSGRGMTEAEVVDVVGDVLGLDIGVDYQPARQFDLPYSVLDISLAQEKLDWEPTFRFQDTVRDLAEHVRSDLLQNAS
jgi:UDP-glucose 4-epimerase